MDRLEMAYQEFIEHFQATPFAGGTEGFVALEWGPGGALFTAPIARAFGAEGVVLVDRGASAPQSVALYKKMIDNLRLEARHDVAALEGSNPSMGCFRSAPRAT